MPAPVIYYIRHGETSWNAEGRLQGAQDTALNELGRKQAVQSAHVLAGLLARGGHDKAQIPYLSSPLLRARTTMELMRAALNLPPREYATDDRLREIGYGQWEGSTLAEMQAADPAFFARRHADKWRVAPTGGETYEAVQRRMRDWYDQVRSDIVVVAHGGTARALMVALGIETPDSASDLPIAQGSVYVFGDGWLKKYS
jgi:broad specificity phosphatase PhoE